MIGAWETTMKRTLLTAAACALAFGFAQAAFAQAAAPAPAAAAGAATDAAAGAATDAAAKATKAAKTAKPKSTAMPKTPVTVANNSGIGLIELDVAMAGQQDVVKIAGPLAAGKKATASVAHDASCLFDIHATYDDGSIGDATGVNLCKDKTINLKKAE
jgi:hypothetical protein